MCAGLPLIGEKPLRFKVAVELVGEFHAHVTENVGFQFVGV